MFFYWLRKIRATAFCVLHELDIVFLSSFKMGQLVFIFSNDLLTFADDWIVFGSDLETFAFSVTTHCFFMPGNPLRFFLYFDLARWPGILTVLKYYFKTWKYKKMTLKTFSNFSLPHFYYTIQRRTTFVAFEFMWNLHENSRE